MLQLKQLGFNLVYAMALGGLQSVHDALILARHQQYISVQPVETFIPVLEV